MYIPCGVTDWYHLDHARHAYNTFLDRITAQDDAMEERSEAHLKVYQETEKARSSALQDFETSIANELSELKQS